MRKKHFMAAIAGLLVLAISSATFASSTRIVRPLEGSGWVMSWDASAAENLSVSMVPDGTTSTQVFIEKFIRFTTDDVKQDGTFVDPGRYNITFTQVAADAKPLVVIDDEIVINDTGFNWTGFRFQILDGSTGTSADTRFDVANSANFNISPFTTRTYAQNDQILTVSGGIVPAAPPGENIWQPGVGPAIGNQLQIIAIPAASGDGMRVFTLKEQPIIVIPLPAAAWTGLTGLVGLGILGSLKKIRSLVA